MQNASDAGNTFHPGTCYHAYICQGTISSWLNLQVPKTSRWETTWKVVLGLNVVEVVGTYLPVLW